MSQEVAEYTPRKSLHVSSLEPILSLAAIPHNKPREISFLRGRVVLPEMYREVHSLRAKEVRPVRRLAEYRPLPSNRQENRSPPSEGLVW